MPKGCNFFDNQMHAPTDKVFFTLEFEMLISTLFDCYLGISGYYQTGNTKQVKKWVQRLFKGFATFGEFPFNRQKKSLMSITFLLQKSLNFSCEQFVCMCTFL